MEKVHRSLVVGGTGWASGRSGWDCSAALQDGQRSATDAAYPTASFALLAGLGALHYFGAGFVSRPARRRSEGP